MNEELIINSIDGEKILKLLTLCDQYVELQTKLGEEMKKGYFQLALSRKSLPRISVENCQFDIDPSLILRFESFSLNTNESELSTEVEPESEMIVKESGNYDSAILFSGLPPKNLKLAQKNFIQAVHQAAKLAEVVGKISSSLKSIDKLSADE
jgi:hypothetical protein